MQEQNQEIKLTFSCILPRGKGKIVRVTFERNHAFAEGIVPDGVIEKHKGFTEEEISLLELYLRKNQTEIFQKAKEITGVSHWF